MIAFDGSVHYISEDATDTDEIALNLADFVNEIYDGQWPLYDQMISDIVDSDDPAWLYEEMVDRLHRLLLTHNYTFGTLPEDATVLVAIPNQ